MKLRTMIDFVLWLRGMTTMELVNEFPNTFHLLNCADSKEKSVTKLLSNDAILYRLIGDYAKLLKKPINLNMFIVSPSESRDNIIFKGDWRYDVDDRYTYITYVNDLTKKYDTIRLETDFTVEKITGLGLELVDGFLK